MRVELWIGLAAMGVALAAAPRAGAQSCDDFDPCTRNDMCTAEGCMGTRSGGASCDDGDECTINDRCDEEIGCTGDPAPTGTRCAGGCGTCQQLFPVPGFPAQCIGDSSVNGRACDADFGACVDGACQVISIPGSPALVFCAARPKSCPESGCRGGCNPETGECDNSLLRCFPQCERCNQQANRCEPINRGNACTLGEGIELCGPTVCTEVPVLGEVRGVCAPGELSGETPTPTALPGTPTPTPPGGDDDCLGDCDDSGAVAVSELITGVNISLGNAVLAVCAAFDANHNGSVEVSELIGAVNSLLNGCDD